MTPDELLHFQFTSWAPLFGNKAFKGKAIYLDQALVSHLLSDGIHVPPDSKAVSFRACSAGAACHSSMPDMTAAFRCPGSDSRPVRGPCLPDGG